jgi:thiamine biosynthesis lipoprotein
LPEIPLWRFEHEAMSTVFEVALTGESQRQARAAAEAAFAAIDRLERLLSRFDPGSEISQINRLAPDEALRVGIDTARCLWLAARAQRETGGAFDVTTGQLVDCWRSPGGAALQPTEEELAGALGRTGMERLELCELSETPDSQEWSVRTINPEDNVNWRKADAPRAFQVSLRADEAPETAGVTVNLGGIGKGFALDRAAEVLADWGVKSALLHGGTSTVLALGKPPAKDGWPLGVGALWSREAGMDKLLLTGGALSGSGVELKGAHIVDPRSGRPVDGSLAAWAFQPSSPTDAIAADVATMADAYSTAFMAMSADEVREFCAQRPEVSALKVEQRGDATVVSRFGPWPGAIRSERGS